MCSAGSRGGEGALAVTSRLVPTSAAIAIQRFARPKTARTSTTALVAEGQGDVLADAGAGCVRLWRTSQGRRVEVVGHQDDVGRLQRRAAGDAAQGDADAGGGQGGGVVDAVADHAGRAVRGRRARRWPSTLSAGSRPARCSPMPSSLAIAAAVGRLSPVSMTVSIPRCVQLGQDPRGLGARPVGQPDPAERARRGGQGHRRPDVALGPAEPVVELGGQRPGLVDVAVAADVILDRPRPAPAPPGPGTAGSRRRSARRAASRRACRAMARPRTCPPRSPRAAAIRSTSSSPCPSAETTSTTSGSPRVRVPVLSNARTRSRPNSSRNSPPLIRTPRRAAAASAADHGDRRGDHQAHGQAITRTTSPR